MIFSSIKRAVFRGSVACLLLLAASPAVAQQTPAETVAGGAEAFIVAARGPEVTLNIGAQDGVLPGAIYAVTRDGQVSARLRVMSVQATQSSATLLDPAADADLAIGDAVQLLSAGRASAVNANPAPVAGSAASPVVPEAAANDDGASTRAPAAAPRNDGNSASPAAPSPLPATPPANEKANGATINVRKTDSVAAQADEGFTLLSGENEEDAPLPQRRNRALDYAAVALAAALALGADASPSSSFARSVIATDQFSVISPFPGGGYTIRPDGTLAPGGAMQVNIPVAYAPRRLTSTFGIFAAQSRPGRNPFGAEIDRNGTVNFGLGFGVRGRGLWLSRMVLSSVGFSGGDSSYNALLQVVSETKSVPAIAVGIQDIKNKSEFSPFVVATKQVATRKPIYLSLGVGSGRFAGSSVFGGVSYAAAKRLSLSAEYDGIQFNLGAVYALSRRLSALLSANDLAESSNRPGGVLGRRFQLGATYGF